MDKASIGVAVLMSAGIFFLGVAFAQSGSADENSREILRQKCAAQGGVIVMTYNDGWSRICIDAALIDITGDA